MRNFLGWLMVFFSLATTSLHGQAIDVSRDMPGVVIAPALRFIEDKSRAIGIDEVKALSPEAFRPSAQQTPNFGFSQSAHWARFEMRNTEAAPVRVFLEYGYANADFVDLFLPSGSGDFIRKRAGDQMPLHVRDVAYRLPVFVIDVPPGTHSYFMRIETEGVAQFPLRLWNPEAFHTKRASESAFIGVVYGFFLVMIFYNLMLGISARSGASLLYVGFIISALGNFFGYHGLWLVFMPDSISAWFANEGFIIISAFFEIFGAWFTYAFLNLKEHRRWIRWMIYASGLIAVAVLPITLISYNLGARVSITNSSITSFAVLAASIAACFRRFRPAYFFTLAWFLSISGNLINPLALAGFMPVNMFTLWGPFLGVAAEAVLISLALGDKLRLQQEQAEQEIRDLNANLERKVEEQTRDIKAIMHNIKLGIFAIQQQNFSIHKDYSRHLEDMFGQDKLQNRPALPLLFQNSSLTDDERSQVQSALEACIGEDEIAFDTNEHCLPREIRYPETMPPKIYQMDWSPMLSSKGYVERVLVTAKDVTEIHRYQSEAESRQKELNYIAELINVSQEKFSKFSASAHHFIEENLRLLQVPTQSAEALKILFINMHTLKGSARSLGFKELTTIVHAAENTLTSLQKGDHAWDHDQLMRELRLVEESLAQYDWVSTHRLNRSLHTLDSIEVRIEDLEKEVQAIEDLQAEPDSRNMTIYLQQMKQRMARYAFRPSIDVFRELCEPAPKLAKDLGKLPPKINIDGAGLVFTHRAVELLRNVFLHILRNALDHGIETAAERHALKKDPQGRIDIHMQVEADRRLGIRIQDDGRGLALAVIKQIAVIKGFVAADAKPSREQLAGFIFESGFSTSSALNEISGRGVGMDAVRRWLEKEGASVTMIFDQGEGSGDFVPFSLHILLPAKLYRQIETQKNLALVV